MTDSTGLEYTLDTERFKVAVYLSNSCGRCVDELPMLQKVNEILCQGQSVQLLLLWEDKIPTKQVEKYDLDKVSYSLGNVSLSSTLDTFFVIDSDNQVALVDSKGFENVMTFLLERDILEQSKLVEYANEFIDAHYFSSNNRPHMVYFSMQGCPDCQEADKIVYGEGVKDNFEIVKIQREKNSIEPEEGAFLDESKIFENIYAIDWYPTFLILEPDGTSRIIREVELTELEDMLIG